MSNYDNDRYNKASDRITQHVTDINSLLTKIQLMIQRPSRWDSPASVAVTLKRILTIARFWLAMRKLVIDYTQDVGAMSDVCKESIEPHKHFTDLRVAEYGSGWHKGSFDAHTIKGSTLVPDYPDCEQLVECSKVVRESETLLRQVDEFYSQTLSLWQELPKYHDIKPVCPIGGRQALCGMMLVYRGTASTTKPSQNELFGFSDDCNKIDLQLLRCTKELNTTGKREKTGPAPSWAGGCRIDRWSRREPNNPTTTIIGPAASLALRVLSFTRQATGYILGMDCVTLPSMAILARKIGHKALSRRVRCALVIGGVRSTMEYRNRVETILTSRPESIGGDDYVATAVWLEGGHGWRDMQNKVSGYVYFRKHWADCFHSDDKLTNDEAHTQLDTSSDYYFHHLANESLRREARRVHLAKIVRRLRSLASVTVADSNKCGNCRPGTMEFMTRLGYRNGDSTTGKRLASLWRRNDYTSQDRFVPVIEQAEQRIKQTVDAFYIWSAA